MRPILFQMIRLAATTAAIIGLFILAEHSEALLTSALLYLIAALLGVYLLRLIASA